MKHKVSHLHVIIDINDITKNNNQKLTDKLGNVKRDRFRSRPTCPKMDCPFNHADSIPTQAIILDMFTEKDKKHIQQYHHSCYVMKFHCSWKYHSILILAF